MHLENIWWVIVCLKGFEEEKLIKVPFSSKHFTAIKRSTMVHFRSLVLPSLGLLLLSNHVEAKPFAAPPSPGAVSEDQSNRAPPPPTCVPGCVPESQAGIGQAAAGCNKPLGFYVRKTGMAGPMYEGECIALALNNDPYTMVYATTTKIKITHYDDASCTVQPEVSRIAYIEPGKPMDTTSHPPKTFAGYFGVSPA